VFITDKDVMKAKVCAAIDAWAAKVEALAQDIEREPELGFKERFRWFKTNASFL
jgi:hypothetical protein